MSRIVFILGAGASAEAGAPVMGNFIATAQEVSRTESLAADEKLQFQLVFKARARLQSVHSKSALDINNIESLFGAFEMAALLGKLGGLERSEIEKLPAAMAVVIARTIEKRIKYPKESEITSRPSAPTPYGDFATLLGDLTRREPGCVSVIAFNYDVALDYALYSLGIPFRYCLEQGTDNSGLDLLKLHGSLNWSRCSTCSEIVAWELKQFFSKYDWSPNPNSSFGRLEFGDRLSKHSHCEGSCLQPQPMIVPPTWNKGKFHSQLENVWRTAAGHLAEAENIFVVGYSLPPTDEFFRYFYALGSVGDSVFENFSVVDPIGTAAERFRSLLGPAATDSFRSACARDIQQRNTGNAAQVKYRPMRN
jgi:NAD-dependent SIR2 family protein deacetylase